MFMASRTSFLLFPFLALGLLLAPGIAQATAITLQSSFTHDDDVQLFNLAVASPESVDIRSYGYAGGTTSTRITVPRGGFDTILTLFDGTGMFLTDNDEGSGVATDPATGEAFDARITTNLTAGSYLVALTQFDNFSIGNLADGFAETGHPNFTAASTFTTGGPCSGNMFRDISDTAGRCRNGSWTVDFVNVASVTPVTSVPEPGTVVLLGLGLGLLLVGRRRSRRRATVLAGAFVAALAGVPVQAQPNPAQTNTGPDYSQVSDFLNGQRSLLKVQDLAIFSNSLLTSYVQTANSQQTKAAEITFGGGWLGLHGSFSASMFNKGYETAIAISRSSGTLTLLLANGYHNNEWNVYYPANPTGAAVQSKAAADFTGDGFEDLALNLSDHRLVIATPSDVNDTRSAMREVVSPASKFYDMVAGDFNGDGHPEIAGLTILPSGGLQLQILTVDPKTLTVTLASSLTLNTPQTPIAKVAIARGRFRKVNHDQLGVAFASDPGYAYAEIIDFKPDTLTPFEASPAPGKVDAISFSAGFIQLKAGKFSLPESPFDSLVYHRSSPDALGRYFEVLKVDPANLTISEAVGVAYDQLPCAIGIEIGNFDHRDGADPNLNDQIAFMYCASAEGELASYAMNIYSVDPTTLDVNASVESILDLSLSAQLQNATFTPVDTQGRSLTLGEPTVIDLTSLDQPSVVVGVPPMHVDFVSPDPGDGVPPTVLNLSVVPGKNGFTNTYNNQTSDEHPTTSSEKTSWSFGATESAGAKFTVGDPEKGSGESFSEKFTAAQKLKGSVDNITKTFQSHDFSLQATSGMSDVLVHKDKNLRIWVYPVIGQTVCPKAKPDCSASEQVPLTIQFSAPTTDNPPVISDGPTLSWYQPPWEPGNILSYPANLEQLQSMYPGPGSCDGGVTTQKSSLCELAAGDGFFTDTSGSTQTTNWKVGSESETDTGFNQNYSFESDFSVTSAVGVGGAITAKFGGELDLSGSAGLSNATTESTKLGISTGLTVNKPGSFRQPETSYEYLVTPYIFGNVVTGGVVDNKPLDTQVQTFGLMRAAFTANPLAAGAGTWWKEAYKQALDVALNHPARWKITKHPLPDSGDPMPTNCLATPDGLMGCAELNPRKPDDPWQSTYHRMRGLFVSSASSPGQGPQLETAKAGDVLTLQARVYNYSLLPMGEGTEVHVRFYFTPWNDTAAAGPSVLIHEELADPVPPFSGAPGAPPNWVLVSTPFDTSQFAQIKDGNVNVVFWVLVWMQDKNGNLLTEMPGHGLTGIPGTLTSFADVADAAFANAAQLEECQPDGNCYSNNLGFYPQVFYIAEPPQGEGAPIPLPSGLVDIGKVKVSAKEGNVILSATLSSSGGASSGVSVQFYDGDPDRGGRLFDEERIPHIAENASHQVAVLYPTNTCGVHQLFAVVNKGRSSEVVRRAQPVRVACNTRR